MIVVDTNIISYLHLASDHSREAEQVLLKDSHWAAPILWRSEFRNVLSFYMRREVIDLPDAVDIFECARSIVNGEEYNVSATKVLQLSSLSGCTAYDCEFVALAISLKVPLITMDKTVLRRFPEESISPLEFIKG